MTWILKRPGVVSIVPESTPDAVEISDGDLLALMTEGADRDVDLTATLEFSRPEPECER